MPETAVSLWHLRRQIQRDLTLLWLCKASSRQSILPHWGKKPQWSDFFQVCVASFVLISSDYHCPILPPPVKSPVFCCKWRTGWIFPLLRGRLHLHFPGDTFFLRGKKNLWINRWKVSNSQFQGFGGSRPSSPLTSSMLFSQTINPTLQLNFQENRN